MMNWKKASLAAIGRGHAGLRRQPAMAQERSGPGRLQCRALKGKRVIMVPMAMGFDLAQGWAAYICKREVEGFGGIFETRDPNWSIEAGAQAITEADLLRSQAGRAGRPFARSELLLASCSRRRRPRGSMSC